MQTFKQFLLGEDKRKARTNVVSVEAFIKWADSNARLYMEGPNFLYRGGSGDTQKGLRIGNAAGAGITPRESANTYNNYTLWIDNHPSFKGWPKRSLSFIATDDREVADNFGGASLLVIHDEAQIGLCGVGDLWETELAPIGVTIEELNGMTQAIIDTHVTSYEQLVTIMKNYELEDTREEFEKWSDTGAEILETMEKRGLDNLYELWEFLVKPDIFAGKTLGHAVGDKRTGGEVWIQGEVGFIPHINRLSEADANRLTEWADQYPNLLDEIQNHWSQDSYD